MIYIGAQQVSQIFVGSFGSPQIYINNYKTFPSSAPAVVITVTPSSYSNVASSGGSVTFTVSSSQSGWAVSSNQSWVSASKTNNTKATCTLQNNSSISGRSATISFTYNGTTYATATISQAAAAAYFTLTPSGATVSGAGGSGSFTVSTNVPTWTAQEQPDYSWFSISRNGNTISWTAEANSGVARGGTIVISGDGATATFQVRQLGYTFNVSYSQLEFAGVGGTATLTINNPNGYSWNIQESASWLSFSQYSGNSSATITMTVSSNVGLNPRDTLVTINETSQGHTFENWISQEAVSVFVFPTSLNYAASGGTKTLDINDQGNFGWSVASKPSWISVSSSQGTGTTTINVSAARYNGTSERSGTMVIKDSTYSAQSIVSLAQTGSYNFSCTPTSMTFPSSGGSNALTINDPDSYGWTIEIPLSLQSWIRVTDRNDNDVLGGTGTTTVYVKADVSGSGSDDLMIFDDRFSNYVLVTITK